MKRFKKPSRQVPDEEAASPSEVRAALDSLSDGECRRLERYAQSRVGRIGRGVLSCDASAFICEAIRATCEGDRRWHKTSVDFFGHLIGVIRSSSSHWRKKAASNNTYLESDLVSEEQTTNPVQNSPSRYPDPEATLLAKEAVERIETAVGERLVAWVIMEGLREGMNRAEIRKEYQISETDYDTNLRWLRRTVHSIREGRS